MGLHEQERRLTDQQRDILQDQHLLIYAGINNLSKARSKQLTQDEISECAKNVIRQFCKYNPDISKPSTYIYSSCRFAVRNALKQRMRGKNVSNRSEINLGGVIDTSFVQAKEEPYKEPIPKRIVSELYDEVESLPATMARCIKARILEKKSYKEIGMEYNKSSSWSHMMVKQGIARLKSRLNHWSEHENTFPES